MNSNLYNKAMVLGFSILIYLNSFFFPVKFLVGSLFAQRIQNPECQR